MWADWQIELKKIVLYALDNIAISLMEQNCLHTCMLTDGEDSKSAHGHLLCKLVGSHQSVLIAAL